MAYEEHILIDIFVANTLQEKAFLRIIDNWPVKLEVIHSIALKHFMDLGIFYVEPFAMTHEITKQLMVILKTSPILKDTIQQAKKQAARAANRKKNKPT